MTASPLPSRPLSWMHPTRALAVTLREHAPAWLWRSLHPLARQPFDEAGPPSAVELIIASTGDGWRLPVRYLPPCPGGAGEPVLLLHTLGLGPDAFRYGRSGTLADRLSRAGFACYLPVFRTDREAEPPRSPGASGLQEVAEHDLPAIIGAVLQHARARRVLVLGHGLGGLAALAWVAETGGSELAALVVMSSPVTFPELRRSAAFGLRAAASGVGVSRRVPLRRLARLLAVCSGGAGDREHRSGPAAARGPRWRGALVHVSEDVPVGLMGDLASWCEAGALVDGSGVREYGLALGRARAPLLVVTAPDDSWCPPARAEGLLRLWGGATEPLMAPPGYGHLDLVLHPEADQALFAPVVGWLGRHREEVWWPEPRRCRGPGA